MGLVDQRADQGNAETTLEVEPLGVGDGRMFGQVVRIEARTAILDENLESVIRLVAANDDSLVDLVCAVGLDGVRARLGHGQLQIVDPVIGDAPS